LVFVPPALIALLAVSYATRATSRRGASSLESGVRDARAA